MANNRYVKVVRESGNYGSGTGTLVGVLATSVDDPIDRGAIKEETLDNINVKTVYGGGLKLSGSIEGSLRPVQMKDLIYSALGVEGASGGNGVYTLGYPKALVLEIGEDIAGTNLAIKYKGAAVKDLTLTMDAKDFVKAKFGWIAKDIESVAYSEPTYSAEEPCLFYGASISLGGTAIAQGKKVDFKVGKNLREDNFVIGSFKLSGLAINGVGDVSGTVTFTELEYNQMKAAAFSATNVSSIPAGNTLFKGALALTFTNPAGATVMTISAANCNFTKANRSMQGRQEITKSVDFIISGDDLAITIMNSAVSAPVANFTASPLSVAEGATVTFTDTSTGTPTAWAWNFGDGSTSSTQNPTHAYTTAGTYTVTLVATNAGGSDTEVKSGYITVTT
jgi:plastocyanin